jgi:hypothetical protein
VTVSRRSSRRGNGFLGVWLQEWKDGGVVGQTPIVGPLKPAALGDLDRRPSESVWQTLASNRIFTQPSVSMSFQAVIKSVLFLALLFVMLYVGMNNPHQIDFRFPIAGVTAKDPIHAPAAIIYFGVFAVGVLAGTLLHSSKTGKKSGGSKNR